STTISQQSEEFLRFAGRPRNAEIRIPVLEFGEDLILLIVFDACEIVVEIVLGFIVQRLYTEREQFRTRQAGLVALRRLPLVERPLHVFLRIVAVGTIELQVKEIWHTELDRTRAEVILGEYPFHRLGNRLEIRIIVEEQPAGILRPAGLLSPALFSLLGLFLPGGRVRTEIHADRSAEERTTEHP